jgi:oligopeptide transport system ATP-binding protein
VKSTRELLRVEDLHTSFWVSRGVIRAVAGVSFSINSGEMLGVVGESGCGKSVTGLSIMRLVPRPGRVTEGEVWFEKQDLLTLDKNEMRLIRGNNIAMIFQDPMTSLNPVLTIARQLTEAITAHTDCSIGEARSRAIDLLGTVGISSSQKRIDDYPHQFSGGMRQRVMIAMAISCRPKILIADEPTTALDVTIQAQILELMKNICEDIGTSVMLITHDLGIVAGLCQNVVVMYAGRIVESAPVEDIFSNPRHPYTHGLLTSTPRMDQVDKRLQPIGGSPPSLLDPPSRCAFAPRCNHAIEICREKDPPLEAYSEAHLAACFRKEEVLW